MTIFSYKALTADGRRASGTVEASSRREAGEILRARGVHVTAMDVAQGRASRPPRRVTARRLRQVFLFTSFMRRLLRAGIPVVEALDATEGELRGRHIGPVVARIRDRVAGGAALADALSQESAFFDNLYVAMIGAAESSGTLAEAFETIYRYERRREEFTRQIVSALAYPIVLVSASALAVTFLLSYVVPKITKTLISVKVPLPLVTKALMGVGDVAKSYWPAAVAVIVLLILAPRILGSFAAGRSLLDQALIRLPVIGRFTRSAAVGRFSRTLSALLKTGLRVSDALEIAGRVSRNIVYERAVTAARSRIVAGSDLAGAFKESGLFPGYGLQIIAIGERTGGLADSFEEIALSEEEALRTSAERFLALLEPAIILVMATVVGFIVASVLLPILSISSAVV